MPGVSGAGREPAFVQAKYGARTNGDSFTIRGLIDATGSDPVGDGVAGGATVSMFQASSTGGAFTGYDEIDSLNFTASDCREANGGLSLYLSLIHISEPTRPY